MTASTYAYHKLWTHERNQGLQRTTPAAPAQAHVQALLDAGWSQRAIADAAGIGATTLNKVIEQQRVKHATEVALLGVTEADLLARTNPLGFVLRVGARRRIQALLALGHRHADITAAMLRAGNGCRVPSALILSQRGEWVARMTHDAVVAAYNELSMTVGPSRRTGSRAAKYGFVPPLAWDDETIDNPFAQPLTDDDDGEFDDGLDEVAVERIMAGALHVAAHAQSEERREAARRLAARGMTDAEIGERLGMTGDAVCQTRIRHDIPAGVACSRAAS